jgi:peptidoglycan/LPS O-acetylase OafA/YrhL
MQDSSVRFELEMPHKLRSGEIDSLRALAMLAVIALHAHIFPVGWIGVWLFFVISGFVVTQALLRRQDELSGAQRLADFGLRRVARIFPVYFAYIGAGLLATPLLGIGQDPLNLASLIFFFSNATIPFGHGSMAGWPSGHLWTLATEMQFYLFYGVALCCLPHATTKRLLIALLLLCPLLRFALGVWLTQQDVPPLDTAFVVYAAPVLHFDIFAMGALLAFAAHVGTMARHARLLALIGIWALVVYTGFYVGVNLFVRHAEGVEALRNTVSGILAGEHREAWVYSAIGLAMTGLVALAATRDGLMRPLLRWKLLQRIGVISYGGYLYHQLGLRAGTEILGLAQITVRGGSSMAHILQYLIGLVLTLLLAEASFRWFETPSRRWIEAMGRKVAPHRAPIAMKVPVQ